VPADEHLANVSAAHADNLVEHRNLRIGGRTSGYDWAPLPRGNAGNLALPRLKLFGRQGIALARFR